MQLIDTRLIYILLFIKFHSSKADSADKCFCHLSGQIDDCFCDIESLEKFNNENVYPILKKLIKTDYFRYFKVNLYKTCMYFDGNAGLCTAEGCGVKICPPDKLPVGLRNGNYNKYTLDEVEDCTQATQSTQTNLGDINGTLSNAAMGLLDKIDRHDDTLMPFCDLDEENSDGLQYVDLLTNPERFTGYNGEEAWKIWRAIYDENCFIPEDSKSKPTNMFTGSPFHQAGAGRVASSRKHPPYLKFGLPLTSSELQGMCLEKRVFYRVISGLHTSINTHVSAVYLYEDGEKKVWKPNLNEFKTRFDPTITNGEGTARLKNLYFIYLIELRAISKLAPYFENEKINLYTGQSTKDEETKSLLLKLLNETNKFPMHFDEGMMFRDKNSQSLKKEFAERFLNVTRIIDCVTCDKCRLWGKLQTQGLGTALKILFTGDDIISTIKLIRQEIVSLVNAFAQLSSSITFIDTFRNMMVQEAVGSIKNTEL